MERQWKEFMDARANFTILTLPIVAQEIFDVIHVDIVHSIHVQVDAFNTVHAVDAIQIVDTIQVVNGVQIINSI